MLVQFLVFFMNLVFIYSQTYFFLKMTDIYKIQIYVALVEKNTGKDSDAFQIVIKMLTFNYKNHLFYQKKCTLCMFQHSVVLFLKTFFFSYFFQDLQKGEKCHTWLKKFSIVETSILIVTLKKKLL